MSSTAGQPPEIRYVLIHQDEQVGTFFTLQDAFDEGTRRYGVPPFEVIEERDDEGGNPFKLFIKSWTPSVHERDPDPRPYEPLKPWYKRSLKSWYRGPQNYRSS